MSTELVQVLQEFGLAEEKKNVVGGLLQPFFAKAEEWKAMVDSIVITDPSQTDKMALAKTGRLQLKNIRLEAEKLVKSQRGIIKDRMADDVLEDKLWLRSGQIMEAVFKNIETKYEEKEKFAERWEAEQEEIRRQERISVLAQYDVVEMPGLGKMSEDQFQTYVAGLKAQHESKLKAEAERLEAERIQNLHNERKMRLSKYADFIPNFDELNLGSISEELFVKFGTKAKADKDAHDAEQARIKAENERLQKEKEEAEAKALAEQKRIQDEANAKLKAEQEARLKAEQEAQVEANRLKSEADAKIKAEQDKARKAQEEADKLKQAEQSRKQAEAKAEADKLAEAERVASQGEKQRINEWIDSFVLPPVPHGNYTQKAESRIQEINAKFDAFKTWAKSNPQLNK